MIKLLIVKPASTHELCFSEPAKALEYMSKTYKNGGYAFYLDFNLPSPVFAYHQIKQRLYKIEKWQKSHAESDIKGIFDGVKMLEKYWKIQCKYLKKELVKKAKKKCLQMSCV